MIIHVQLGFNQVYNLLGVFFYIIPQDPMLNTVNISQPKFVLTLFTGLKDFFGLFSFNFRLFSLS